MFAAPSFAAIFDASGHSECRRRLLTSTLAHSDIKTGLDQIRNYEVDALPELSALSRELSTLQQSYNRANNDLSFREKNEHTKVGAAVMISERSESATDVYRPSMALLRR